MHTKAVRIYGKNDLRLEEFELPAIKENEILAKVVCDSLCMSSYKAAMLGIEHKRIPNDVNKNPVIIGHEFSGEIIEVGQKWKSHYKAGMKFSVQPALYFHDGPVGVLSAPGYSYQFIGGDATYIIIPNDVMINNCLLIYDGPGHYPAAFSEPLSCVMGAMHANYHTKPGSYIHQMGIMDGGNMAILAGGGPMGLAAINYALFRRDKIPKLLVVTDIDQQRLDRAAKLFSIKEAAEKGIELRYINTSSITDPLQHLLKLTNDIGYNDVFVFSPITELIELADDMLAFDGCLNFFAGPSDPSFKAKFNFHNVHYQYTHVVGTNAGNSKDMNDAIQMMSKGLDPAGMITHIGGLNAVISSTLNLPKISGGKKLIYTNISLELTAIADFEEKGKTISLFKELAAIVKSNKGLWCLKAEEYLLKNAGKI